MLERSFQPVFTVPAPHTRNLRALLLPRSERQRCRPLVRMLYHSPAGSLRVAGSCSTNHQKLSNPPLRPVRPLRIDYSPWFVALGAWWLFLKKGSFFHGAANATQRSGADVDPAKQRLSQSPRLVQDVVIT